MNKTPTSIQSDDGSEFIATSFKNLLKSKKIKQVSSLPGKSQSNGNIERFNGTFKRNSKMIRTSKDDPNCPNYLDDVIDNYSNSKHKVTNKTPNDAKSSSYNDTKENIITNE